MVMHELKQLFKEVAFEDITPDVVDSLCDLIVEGKQCDYRFTTDLPTGLEYQDAAGGSASPYMPHMNQRILMKSGLLQVTELDEKSYNGRNVIVLRPTPKGMEIYERLAKEGILNEEGYLIGGYRASL